MANLTRKDSGNGPGVYVLAIVDDATIDAAGDVEAKMTLRKLDRALLNLAVAEGKCYLRVTTGAETGSAAFTIDKLEFNWDGSDTWLTWEDLTNATLDSATTKVFAVTVPVLDATHIRINASSETLSGSAYFASSTIAFVCIVPCGIQGSERLTGH